MFSPVYFTFLTEKLALFPSTSTDHYITALAEQLGDRDALLGQLKSAVDTGRLEFEASADPLFHLSELDGAGGIRLADCQMTPY